MTLQWLQPWVWWGLTLIAVPVVIHLLARNRTRRMRFPSLRFVPVSQMAALRRRVISDWPLLLIRVLIIALAVAAAAWPVIVSDARRKSWDRRVALAVVLAPSAGDEATAIARAEADASYVSAMFSDLQLPDAIRGAVDWLRQQPPAARELVIVGDLREGMIAEHELNRVPPYAGIRFLPLAGVSDDGPIVWRAVANGPDEQPQAYAVAVTPEVSRTRVEYGEGNDGLTLPRVRVVASASDQEYADAVLRAVLRDGLMLGAAPDRAVTVAFEGAAVELQQLALPSQGWMRTTLEQIPDVRGGERDGGIVVRSNIAVRDPRAPHIVAAVLRAAFAQSRAHLEPRRVSAAALAAWSRPAGGSPPDVRPADEGDRRWFWGAVLGLLAVEHIIRRRRRVA